MTQVMPELMLFPFIDRAMMLIAFTVLLALPMLMRRPASPQALERLRRRRAYSNRYSDAGLEA
ncbi:MAG TPA: hypothetical protein VGE51_10455 [Fontimonas sp.]